MKKWMIIDLNVYRIYGLNFEGYIKFRIWDDRYYCSEINVFIKDLINNNKIRNKCIIEKLRWVDFKILARYDEWDWWYVFEIELIDSFINSNRIRSFLIYEGGEK